MKIDRARIQLGRISPFGLLELSRQRLRPSILESSTAPCPYCSASGYVRTRQSVALHILRGLEEEGIRRGGGEVTITAPRDAALHLLNEMRERLVGIEQRYGLHVWVNSDEDLIPPNFNLLRGSSTPSPVAAIEAAPVAVQDLQPDEAEAEADEEERPADRGDRKRGRGRRRRRKATPGSAAEGAEAAEAQDAAEAPDDGGDDNTAGGDAADRAADRAAAPSESGEDGAEERPRRRRRGKRGGRRRTRRNGEESGTATAEATGDSSNGSDALDADTDRGDPESPQADEPHSAAPDNGGAERPHGNGAPAPSKRRWQTAEPDTLAETESESDGTSVPSSAEAEHADEAGPKRRGWWNRWT